MRIHKFGDNINTDLIIPARYLNLSDPSHLSAHCMEDINKDFSKIVNKGDIIVGGKNFGCGSSREHAPIAIKACGVYAVIAESFARIFYRNAINIGLYIIESPEAVKNISETDEIKIDIQSGIVENLTTGAKFQGTPFPPFIQKIVEKGGLLNCINEFSTMNID